MNALWKDYLVNQGNKEHYYVVNEETKFRVCDAKGEAKIRHNADTIYALYNTKTGKGNQVPLWLLGFLY